MPDVGLVTGPENCPSGTGWLWVEFYRGPQAVVWWRRAMDPVNRFKAVNDLLLTKQTHFDEVNHIDPVGVYYHIEHQFSDGRRESFNDSILQRAGSIFGSVRFIAFQHPTT